ncbi:MAG: hypothetical protein QW076_02495 [Candidatus Anstonellales archaeon]
MTLLNNYAYDIFIYLLLFLISSLCASYISLVVAINGIVEIYNDIVTLVSLLIVFIGLSWLKMHAFFNKADFIFKDFFACLIILVPIFSLMLFSQLPLVDDIRYLGTALIVPNGIIVLPATAIVAISRILNISIITVYWLFIGLSLYLLTLIILMLLKKISLNLSKHFILNYLFTFIILFTPSIITAYLLPILFTEPTKVNTIIFKDLKISHLGRMASFDPNLMKNIAVLLPLSTLIIGKRDKFTHNIFISFVYMLAFLSHLQNSIIAILLTEFLNVFLKQTVYLKKFIITEWIPLSLFLTLLYTISGLLFSFSQVSFIWIKDTTIIYLIILNLAIFLSVTTLPSVIFALLSLPQRESNSEIEYDKTKVKLPREIFYYVLTLLSILVLANYDSSFFLVYYPIPLLTVLSFFLKKSARLRILQFLTFPSMIIILSLSLYNLSIYENFFTAFSDIARYLSVTIRNLMMPGCVISVIMSFVYFFTNIKFIKKSIWKLIIPTLLLSLINATFYVFYWGYYYRNPWANSVAGTANITNHVLSEVTELDLSPTPFVHTTYSDMAIMTKDIIGLHIGHIFLNPTTVNDEKIPIYIRRIHSFVPDIIIAEDSYDVLKNILSPRKEIIVKENKKVNIYIISEPKSYNVKKAAIIGPVAHPALAPEYYIELLKLQSGFQDLKLMILESESEAKDLGIPVIGVIKFIDANKVPMVNLSININALQKSGYKYLYIRLRIKSSCPTFLCCNISKSFIPNIYPAYVDKPLSFLISLEQLKRRCQCKLISFPTATQIIPVKDYELELRTFSK